MLSTTQPAVHRLPFVHVTTEETCFWSPDRSGDYSTGVARGKAYAADLIAFIATEQNPVIFGSVIRAMITEGRYEAVEIGFCHGVGLHLIDVAMEPLRRAMAG